MRIIASHTLACAVANYAKPLTKLVRKSYPIVRSLQLRLWVDSTSAGVAYNTQARKGSPVVAKRRPILSMSFFI
jgi:hypothetical protein